MKKTLLACFSASLLTLCASAAMAGELTPSCMKLTAAARVCTAEYINMLSLDAPGHEKDIADASADLARFNKGMEKFSDASTDVQNAQCAAPSTVSNVEGNNMALVAVAHHLDRAHADEFMGGCLQAIR
jgi:hypothetical protein